MKQTKQMKFRIITVLVLLLFVAVGFFNSGLTASAAAASTSDSLHTQTKIYSSNNDDYFNGCEDYDDYVNSAPTITVLTHGLGSADYYWSNDYSVHGGSTLAYNSSSLISKIYEKLDGQMTLYVASGIDKGSTYDFDFELIKYSYDDYVNANGGKTTSVLDDVSNHIVIVFNSSVSDKSNHTVYNEFHDILDNISAQYKNLTGVLPRFNLVGHSRGGITNIMYATEHPYNVASVFSMGTPYSGSVLGELEILLAMMGYADEETYEVINEGVNSIMDEEELQDIRDAWNSAYTSDVNMNVVAYGSMASIHLLDALLEDMEVNYEKYEEDYGTVVKDYSDLINTVVNVIDDCPGLTSSTLNFVDGLAEVFDDFGVDLFDILFTKIDPNLEGKITYEEASDVLSLVNVINNEVVIMDDLFIDLNSQLGYGFEDGISYNGFKRYTKIFGAADYTDNRAIPGQPGVVHNLEIMNETYTNDIANSLVFGTPESTIVKLSDDFSGSYSFNLGRAFGFTPTYTGERKFTASDCTIKLYQYDTNNCLQLIESVTNSLTYEYDRNTQYLLIVEANSANNIGVSFNLEEKMGLGDNTVEVGANDERVYKLTASTSGYYLVSVSNTKASLSGVNYITTGKYYIYLKANTSKYIHLINSATYSITVNVEVYEPSEIDLNQETKITNSNQKVMKFTNPYNSSMAYKLDISWTSETDETKVYNSNGNTIGATTTSGTNKTFSFTLSAGQTCYVIYPNTDSSITSNLYINPTQLRWSVDGELYDTNHIQLPRGDSYTIELVVLYNGTIVDYTSPYVNTSSTNFVFSNNILSIDEEALIGYDITIYPTLAPDYLLTVQIGYDNEFSWSVTNSDTVTLSWNVNETFDRINFTITNTNGTYTLSKSSSQFDITSYLPISVGTTTIKLNSIVINGITFSNGTKFLNVSSKTVNNLFAGGSGTSSSPYTISCYRHLNNIRKSTSKYYKQTVNLFLDGYTWEPIPSFTGVYDGNNKAIHDLNIQVKEAATSDTRYGFVAWNNGTIKNVKMYYCVLENQHNNPAYFNMVGSIAGNTGTSSIISNCYVYYGEINFATAYRDQVGGIAGQNHGTIEYCYVNYMTMTACCYTGGIVGYNCGTVKGCEVSNDIYVKWNTESKAFGGIAGYNSGNIVTCWFKGYIEFKSPKRGSDIYPMLGYIIGWNHNGTYSDTLITLASYKIDYYYFWPIYNQSDYCFALDGGRVGYSGN